MDTYESHEGVLYCKPHFRTLFTPKAVENNEPGEGIGDGAVRIASDAIVFIVTAEYVSEVCSVECRLGCL